MSELKIQCFYLGQRALFLGANKPKGHYKVKTADGNIHYPQRLENIDFKNHSTDQELFKKVI